MKKHIVIISLIVMYSALCFASSPKWLIDLEKAFPSDLYIRAVGEGVSESSAKKVALSELSAYFHQTISSQTQSLKRIDREDSYFKETADVRQKLNTSTESELFSVQYTKSFYDKNSNKFYICAYIEKDHAWNVISQKMDVTAGACKSYLDSVKNEPEDLLKVINLNRAEKFFAKFNSLYEMALVINPVRCKEYSNFAEKTESKLTALSAIRNQTTVCVIVKSDHQNRIRGIITALLSENGITVTEQNAKYTLNADVVWNESTINEIYFCEPHIQIQINRGAKTLTSFAASCEKVSAYNQNTAEQLSIAHLKELLEERFITECFR